MEDFERFTVEIPTERFEQLINEEARLHVLAQQVINDKYISTEDILRIIGTVSAIQEADRLKAQKEEDMKRYSQEEE